MRIWVRGREISIDRADAKRRWLELTETGEAF
jgi:hypothetical protein